MKTCTQCGISKPPSKFRTRSTGKLHSWCKDCEHASEKIYNRKRRLEFLIFKSTLSCKHCGINDGLVMTFHHKDPKTKLIGMNVTSWNKNRKKFNKELPKCIPLCHNCHFRLHQIYTLLFGGKKNELHTLQ